MGAHILSFHATPAVGSDAAVAEVVRDSMRKAKLSAEVIDEFTMSDLLEMHRQGYNSAPRITAAQRPDLEKCNLDKGLIGLLLTAVEDLRGELESYCNGLNQQLSAFVAGGGHASDIVEVFNCFNIHLCSHIALFCLCSGTHTGRGVGLGEIIVRAPLCIAHKVSGSHLHVIFHHVLHHTHILNLRHA